jgi:hypothetical protein
MRRNPDHFFPTGTVLKEDSVSATRNACADGRITRFFNLDPFFLVPLSVKDPRKIVCNLRMVLEIQVAIFKEVASKVEFITCMNSSMQMLARLEVCNQLFSSGKVLTNSVKVEQI